MAVDMRLDDQFYEQPVILFLHGFKGFKDWGHFPLVAEAFAAAGFAFINFNFSHNGTTLEQPTDFADLEAFGHNNYDRELFDTQRVMDSLCNGTLFPNVRINCRKVMLLGHSRGGGIAVITASEDKRIKALATWAGLADMRRLIGYADGWKEKGVIHIPNGRTGQQMPIYYQFAEDCDEHAERYDLEERCGELEIPALFVHGSEDPTVPEQHAHDLANWSPDGNAFIIPEANHTFGGKHPYNDELLPDLTLKAIAATVDHFRSV